MGQDGTENPDVVSTQHFRTKTPMNNHIHDCKNNSIIITMWCKYTIKNTPLLNFPY